MARDAYVALHWDRAEASALDTARLIRCRSALDADGSWRLGHQGPGLWVFVHARRPIAIAPLGGGVLLGDLFDRHGAQVERPALASTLQTYDPLILARGLADGFWGRYVAILPQACGPAVFRDPIGGLDCVAWRKDGVVVAASTLPDPVLLQFGEGVSIDWLRLGQIAADATEVAGAPALRGLRTVEPGVLTRFAPDQVQCHPVWRPSQVAGAAFDGEDPALLLEQTIDRCVGAWARAYPAILAELSGGLDSALVGSALQASATGPVQWFNQYVDDPAGDERSYARAMARRLAVRLRTWRKPPMAFRPEDFEAVADGVRPTFNGSDAPSDLELARRARAGGADAIFTGQGGDIVLYQLTTPLVAADRARRLGPRALTPEFLEAAATWNQTSVWSVLRAVWIGGGRQSAATRSAAVVRPARRPPPHAWRAGSEALAPGKRFQLRHLTYCPVFFGASRRGAAAALIHPLLSQPIVELCLRLPSDVLTEGGQGRGLVRRAFKDRLAPQVIDRQTKADMTRFYGHAVANGLDAIRPYLLDGLLTRQGIIDRPRLDALLTVEALSRDGAYGDLVDLLAIEAFARCWEARLTALAAARPGAMRA